MALTCGFFNSVSGDRVYNADQMSAMFEGLISDGIFENIGQAFQVTASSGMTVNVGTGRAFLSAKWVRNTAPISINITAAHALLNRWTAVVLRLDTSGRDISVVTIDGTPASSPSKPAITRDNSYFDLLLAYIYVGAGTTSISQSNINDQRANTTYCGWVTGLVDQVDTSTLFIQWETAYQEAYADMQTWEATEKAAFDEWFAALTDELGIMTYNTEYIQTVKVYDSASRPVSVTFNPSGYTYSVGDIFDVYINGLAAESGIDYTVSTSGTYPVFTFTFGKSPITAATGEWYNMIKIRCLKSVIGWASANA